jgi:transposase
MSGYPLDSFGTFKRSEWISLIIPDRKAETVKKWMQAHPEIDWVSRDRGGDYASAASQGVPHAAQSADRFHASEKPNRSGRESISALSSGTAKRDEESRAPRSASGGSASMLPCDL